ncbi:hypothetical protein SAMN05216352_108109 [Alteribacillus bidgolensis]|uniref:Uncharacterized protein n=2 Tax=Alteribacillus bidgolensis TaxID=930129 RepID=A0A1G8L1F8_9BACI|nr:hypothetical protein SAMN05216352_108109 [Alteribacillus bidgolensis]
MGLDEQTKYVLDQMGKTGGYEMHALSPERAREAFVKIFARQEEAVSVGNVENFSIVGPDGSIPVRVYYPEVECDTYPVSYTIMEGVRLLEVLRVMMVYAGLLQIQRNVSLFQ